MRIEKGKITGKGEKGGVDIPLFSYPCFLAGGGREREKNQKIKREKGKRGRRFLL